MGIRIKLSKLINVRQLKLKRKQRIKVKLKEKKRNKQTNSDINPVRTRKNHQRATMIC